MIMSLDAITKKLHHLTTVSCEGMGVDNLLVDQNGDVFAAAFPAPFDFLAHASDPFSKDSSVSIFRIRKVGEPYTYIS